MDENITNDLSDEAFRKWCKSVNYDWVDTPAIEIWQECRRRAYTNVAKLEKEIDLLNKLLAVIISACESYIKSKND